MRAVLTAVIAAIEAVAIAVAGFAIVAVPALLIWWLGFGLAADPRAVFAAAAAGWSLAHFVPLALALDAESAQSLGLAAEPLSFTVSLAPLGLTILTASLAARAGRRFAARGGAGGAGVLGGMVGFAAAAAAISLLGASLHAWGFWPSVVIPALAFGACSATGFVLRSAGAGDAWWRATVRALQRTAARVNPLWASALPGHAAAALRLTAICVLAVTGLAGVGVAVSLVVGYVDIITLSQQLQLDVLGLIMVFLLSLAVLPVALAWAIAWFSGAGFAVGIGTSVTPFETLLGPLPAFPLFGALPGGWGWAGGLAPALVVLLGAAIGVVSGALGDLRRGSLGASIAVPVIAAALAGLAVVAVSGLAHGAIGPGRLELTGADPWRAGGLIALELALGLVPGVLASRLDLTRSRGRAGRWGARGEDGAGANARVGGADLAAGVPGAAGAGAADTDGAPSAGGARGFFDLGFGETSAMDHDPYRERGPGADPAAGDESAPHALD
ncbi:MAG: hypothetical protein KDB25_09880 [Leucobacter sp.]|nr:hypothetical protein [Leucobacter sp.]